VRKRNNDEIYGIWRDIAVAILKQADDKGKEKRYCCYSLNYIAEALIYVNFTVLCKLQTVIIRDIDTV
jgi:hypothetical protein